MSPEIVSQVFEPILGLPGWLVKKGQGSFLTFEFGDPSLRIREPMEPKPEASDAFNQYRTRRLVTVRGQWHLWIYCCDWEITEGEKLLAHSESSDEQIADATRYLDGQALQEVSVSPDSSTVFRFDLGGVLRTKRWEKEEVSEQWLVYEPSGMVFGIHSNGMYTHHLGNTSPDDMVFLPLFS